MLKDADLRTEANSNLKCNVIGFLRSTGRFRRSDRTTLVAAPGQTQSVFGEHDVSEIHELSDERQSRDPDDGSEADRRIESTEHFDARDPGSIGESAMHRGHQFILSPANRRRIKFGSRNVGKQDPLMAVHSSEQPGFPHAQRTIPVVEHFNGGGWFHLFYAIGKSRPIIQQDV